MLTDYLRRSRCFYPLSPPVSREWHFIRHHSCLSSKNVNASSMQRRTNLSTGYRLTAYSTQRRLIYRFGLVQCIHLKFTKPAHQVGCVSVDQPQEPVSFMSFFSPQSSCHHPHLIPPLSSIETAPASRFHAASGTTLLGCMILTPVVSPRPRRH